MEKQKKSSSRKQSAFICNNCGKESIKADSELKRNLKLDRKNYCSISCATTANNKTRTFEHSSSKENIAHLQTICGNRRDEFTPFRYTFRNSERRTQHEFNLTLQDLKDTWESQNGICPYSKISLVLAEGTTEVIDSRIRASLDRIDSNKGYIKGNIQFVSTLINYMKAELSHEDTLDFIQTLINNNLSFNKDQTISSSQ